MKTPGSHPGPCGSVGWVSFCRPKGCSFDSWSGYMSRLWVWSPVGVHTKGNQSMFLSLLSRIDVSFFLCSPLSKKKKKKGKRKKKRKY